MIVYIAIAFFEMPEWCIKKIRDVEKKYENNANWENDIKNTSDYGFLIT